MKNIHLLNKLQMFVILIALLGAVASWFHFRSLPAVYPGFRDVWLMNSPSDPQFFTRMLFIYSGMGMALISFLLFLPLLFLRRRGESGFWLGLSAFLLVFMITWRSYPYWVYSLQDVFRDNGSSCFDPKALLPMAVAGEFWRLPVLVVQLLVWPLSVVILIREILVFRIHRKLLPGMLIAVFIVLQAAVVFFTPAYLEWLLD